MLCPPLANVIAPHRVFPVPVAVVGMHSSVSNYFLFHGILLVIVNEDLLTSL